VASDTLRSGASSCSLTLRTGAVVNSAPRVVSAVSCSVVGVIQMHGVAGLDWL
jgi:hypothetical protein